MVLYSILVDFSHTFYCLPKPLFLSGSMVLLSTLVLSSYNVLCLDVGVCLKVNTRALGRGALHKKGDSISLLLTSEEQGAEPVEGPSLDQHERSSIYQTPSTK